MSGPVAWGDDGTPRSARFDDIYHSASGGLAQKNSLLMQIYADILQRRIDIAAAEQTSALGAAMWATVAAGLYPDIHAAAERMVRPPRATFQPIRENKKPYDQLFAQYSRLHDYFGRDAESPMQVLRHIQKQA